jgi:hypothetical protein
MFPDRLLERSSRIDWEQRFLATKFQYGVSNEWQPSRLGNGHFQEIVATRLFMSLFGVYQQLPSDDSQIDATWFPITEQQRDLAVQSLKVGVREVPFVAFGLLRCLPGHWMSRSAFSLVISRRQAPKLGWLLSSLGSFQSWP